MSGLLHTHKSETFVGKVVTTGGGGKDIKLNDQRYYRQFIQTKLYVGDTVVMTVTNRKPKRTENQNRYYWMYLGLIADSTGFTIGELHEWAKGVCLPSQIKTILGTPIRIKTSTTDLTVSEFCEYIIEIEKRTGIVAPDTREWSLPELIRK